MTFKVQYVRSCRQCHAVLPMKCKACSIHPERRPVVIEVFDWPKILATCPSGDCIQIQCQRPACGGTMWRNRTHTRGGKMKSEKMYCSKRCNLLVQNSAKVTSVMVPCGWCDKPVKRKQSEIKSTRRVFCHQEHYFLSLRKSAHDAKEEVSTRTSLHCRKCVDVTDHKDVSMPTSWNVLPETPVTVYAWVLSWLML